MTQIFFITNISWAYQSRNQPTNNLIGRYWSPVGWAGADLRRTLIESSSLDMVILFI